MPAEAEAGRVLWKAGEGAHLEEIKAGNKGRDTGTIQVQRIPWVAGN